jgi:signal transduction histidine kinase
MAYGYDSDCGKVREWLKKDPTWGEWCPKLRSAYDEFESASHNKVLWAAWNYWDPTRPPDDQRIMQVVISGDPDIGAVARDCGPFWGRKGKVLLSPQDLTSAGRSRRANSDCHGECDVEVLNNRDYAEGIWGEVFRPSIRRFEDELQLLTAVDFARKCFDERQLDPTVLMPYAFVLGPERSNLGNARTFSLAGAEMIWDWIHSLNVNPPQPTPTEDLVSLWVSSARIFREQPPPVPANILKVVKDFAWELGPDKLLDEAYAVLLHIAWFQKSLLSNYQYVLPVASGSYFSAMYLSTQGPLETLELVAWHQVAVQLFSSLIVHHLSELLRRTEQERKADEQRVALSHSIPKFVFKPVEYFATKLANSDRGKDEATQKISDALLFLSSRGQAALAEYAPPIPLEPSGTHNLGAVLQVDVGKISREVKDVFGLVREFLVHGYIDGAVKRRAGKKQFREELCNDAAVSLNFDVKPPSIVRGNRALLLLHFWNLIDNAFRAADFAAAFVKTEKRLTDALVLTLAGVPVCDTAYRLCFTNTGKPIPADLLDCLNGLFLNPDCSPAFVHARARLAARRELDVPVHLEHERSGIGLARFAEYLWMMWKNLVPPDNRIGSVASTANETHFTFFFPVWRQDYEH